MTKKQKRFVEEYLIDLNATQAAIRAGYSPDTRRIGLIYALTAAAAAALLLAPFYPALLLLFVAIYAVNMYIHYSNKINISLYTSAVKQLSTALKTARYLMNSFPKTALRMF